MYHPLKVLATLLCLAAGTFAGPERALADGGKFKSVVIQTHASDVSDALRLTPDGLIIISSSENNGALKIEVLDHKNKVSETFFLPKDRLLEKMRGRAKVADRTANKLTAALALFFPTVTGGGLLFAAFLQDVLEADPTTVTCLGIIPTIVAGAKTLAEAIQTAYHGHCSKNFSTALLSAAESLNSGDRANLVLKTKFRAKDVIQRMQDELERN